MELITAIHTQTALVSMAYTTSSCADTTSQLVPKLATTGLLASPNALPSAIITRLVLHSLTLVDTVTSSV
jgi:hypothetical protein